MIVNMTALAIRPNVLLKKGDYIVGHTHAFDHVTAVVRGALQIDVEREDGRRGRTIINSPDPEARGQSVDRSCINIPAKWRHTLTALTDNTEFWCLYAPRNESGEIIERLDPSVDIEWMCG